MAIRLALTDIDGTILPHGQKQVSARMVEAFHAALDAGIRVGVATGRGLATVGPVFGGDERCLATAVATNGLQAYLDGELVFERTLPHDELQVLADHLHAAGEGGLIAFDDATPVLVEGDVEVLTHAFAAYGHAARLDRALPNVGIIKANVFCEPEAGRIEQVVAGLNALDTGLEVVPSLLGFGNVLPRGWSKGSAIDVLCEHLGIGIDEVVVFGDETNDLQMLGHVPNSVAVANAVPAVQETARWHIGSCDDGAVADALFSLAQGQWPFVR